MYPQPFTVHPGEYLKTHPVSEFGCTICHGGQGRALNKKEAFGLDPGTHWSKPILYQPYIQSSCGKCHLTIFNKMKNYPGTEIFRHGQEVFAGEGCLGCHKARGVGGIIGPDLTEQGEKSKHEYNFQNIAGEQTVSNWLKEHFRDPEMISPGSRMLKLDIPEEELEALATFVMGLSKPDMPVKYFSIEMLSELKGVRELLSGPVVYNFTCSSCHGKSGEGKDYKQYNTGVPSIMNPDFLRVASEEFIYFTILKGRSRKQMAAWNYEVSGYYQKELKDLTNMIKPVFSPVWLNETGNIRKGNAEKGRIVFENNCATCHGVNGKGSIAVALNQRDFLSRASDTFILRTIAKGRSNTAMPGWPGLSGTEVRNLMTFIRHWYDGPNVPSDIQLPDGDADRGKLLFHYNCSRCHGSNGEGNTGPAIINSDFLNAASEYYLYSTVAKGREHTSMFGWSTDVYNQERLGKAEISDIISYMKQKSQLTPEYIYEGSNPGNSESGMKLYLKNCSECHGENGEGISAPGLNNQEFLSAASNGYIMATMTIGRRSTRMPAWGYGSDEYKALQPKEREDIVAYIRSWRRIEIGFSKAVHHTGLEISP